MNDLAPLAVLLAQSERQRDLAIADRQKAGNDSEGAAAQLQNLRDYRCQYEQRWSAEFCREGQIQLVRCYQSFMERLNQAVEQQERAAAAAAAWLETALATVRERELQVASVRRLLDRRQGERRGAEQRLDQKQSDELAARVAWRVRRATDRPSQA